MATDETQTRVYLTQGAEAMVGGDAIRELRWSGALSSIFEVEFGKCKNDMELRGNVSTAGKKSWIYLWK